MYEFGLDIYHGKALLRLDADYPRPQVTLAAPFDPASYQPDQLCAYLNELNLVPERIVPYV